MSDAITSEREKNEAKTRLVDIRVSEVSLVDRAANECEFVVIKNLEGDVAMNSETAGSPAITVEKAMELSTQLAKEAGDLLKEKIDKAFVEGLDRDERDILWDLFHRFQSNIWVVNEGRKSKKAAKPDEYPCPKVKEADAEKAGASLKAVAALIDDALKLAGDNKDLKSKLDEAKKLLGEMGKYPYPSKEKKDMTDEEKKAEAEKKAAEKAEAEKKAAEKAEAEKKAAEEKAAAEKKAAEKAGETDAEKARKSELAKMVETLEGQQKTITETLKLLKGEEGKAGEAKTPKYEEEMKALAETVKKQGAAIDAVQKGLDEILKTRGTSKAAGEPDPAKAGEREKAGNLWKGIL